MISQDFNPNPIEVKKYPIKADLQAMPEGYPISATVICDSVSKEGIRITTFELEFPRYVLAEFNTHRTFSRNASSSRAIPTKKLITNSQESFVEPVRYGKNKAGMQAALDNLQAEDLEEAKHIWKNMAAYVTQGCARLAELGLHKQWASRPLEWFTTIKVVVTATSYDNFYLLRDHSEAQDEIAHLAQAMKIAANGSTPRLLKGVQWHLPYVSDAELKELGIGNALKVSSARCARTSYKTHHGVTSTLAEDVDLFLKLVHDTDQEENPFHASPTEHQAYPAFITEDGLGDYRASLYWLAQGKYLGNFKGWMQFRKYIEDGVDLSKLDDLFGIRNSV